MCFYISFTENVPTLTAESLGRRVWAHCCPSRSRVLISMKEGRMDVTNQQRLEMVCCLYIFRSETLKVWLFMGKIVNWRIFLISWRSDNSDKVWKMSAGCCLFSSVLKNGFCSQKISFRDLFYFCVRINIHVTILKIAFFLKYLLVFTNISAYTENPMPTSSRSHLWYSPVHSH